MEYTFKLNKRAKRIILSVRADGSLLVTARKNVQSEFIEQFIFEKREWIQRARERLARYPRLLTSQHSHREMIHYKAQAYSLATERLAYFNTFYNFTYTQISIRNQKTRWGSCSRTGSISLNYRISLIPPHLADYIVVHELCHLKQMNHSTRFWKLVSISMPNYAELRAELRKL